MGDKETAAQTQRRVAQAVAQYWTVRAGQGRRQASGGRPDQGARSAVTGGAQMDGFVTLISDTVVEAGISPVCVFKKRRVDLPGYFRATKEWDLVVVKDDVLIAAIETKSQVGPSFGNNFNNRTEEALGSALDVWTAFREGAFGTSPSPFIGYLFMLEACESSLRPVSVREPHFDVFPEFVDASYLKRYQLLCRRLVRERHYSAAALLTSRRDTGLAGCYEEPASDLTVISFLRSLRAAVSIHAK